MQEVSPAPLSRTFNAFLWERLFEKSPSHTLPKNFYRFYRNDQMGVFSSLSFILEKNFEPQKTDPSALASARFCSRERLGSEAARTE